MQVSVEATSNIERRVTIVVPVNTLDAAYDKRIADFAKTAKLDGFRPGKVPLDVVKKRFGDTARQEALSEVIQSSLYSAIHQEKLNPVGMPRVEPKTALPGQPLEFVATFEILPEIANVNCALTKLEKQTSVITDADLEKVIDHLRNQHATWTKVERPIQEKDQAFIDFAGKIDGVAFEGGQAHDYPIIVGSKSMIPGFEEGLLGLKTGEEKTISVQFPENYFAKEFAGKQAEFAVKVIKIMQPGLPEMTNDFIKKLGVKTGELQDLHADIRKNLERELARLINAKLKSQVFDKVLVQNKIDVPKALIEREAKRIHDELHPHHQGHDHGHTDAEMAVFNEAAERNVTLGLLIGALIKKYEIKPNKDRVDAFIANIASAYEKPADVTKWYHSNKNAMAEVEMQILEDQVLEKLLEGVQVTEKQISYNELVASVQQQQQATH